MQARNSATSARSCSRSAQLRRNRTKPSGSASAKNRRSSGVSRSPAQPRMTARSRLSVASSGKRAPELVLPQFAAQALGGAAIRQRPGLKTVVDALVAEIGADRDRRKLAEKLGLRALQP